MTDLKNQTAGVGVIGVYDCSVIDERMFEYLQMSLPQDVRIMIDGHLCTCQRCRQKVQHHRNVPGVEADQGVQVESLGATTTLLQRLGATPWWFVSFAMHFLIIALAGLVTMAIDLPHGEDAAIMITELQRSAAINLEQEKSKTPETALESKLDTTPTDPMSRESSDIIVPRDILAKAELGDHFETINPDRPDTHSAYGNEEARMFYSVEGNADKAGGGGTVGIGLDDVIGVGGAGSRGTGGGFGGGDGTGVGIGTGAGKGSFGNRNGGGRKLMIKKNGGTKATESAVDLALHWLAYHQEADGHWDSKKYGGARVYTAMTGLALLAFLGAGHSEKVGSYRDNVRRAVIWLRSKQEANGLVFDRDDESCHPNYNKALGYGTAIATMALAEAAGMGDVKETRLAAQKAIDYCTEIHQQGDGSEKGAWRYEAKTTPDLSVSGWYIMALKSAKVAGLHVNPASFEGAMKFLDAVEIKEGKNEYGPISHYGYRVEEAYPSAGSLYRIAAIGTLGRQFLGWPKEKLQGGVEWFVEKGGVPEWGDGGKKVDLYYWYYGTLCVFQNGGDVWKRWNESLKTVLPEHQSRNGDDTGSWNPTGYLSDFWGRVGQTAFCALSLEVYYRYQRLNQ